MHLFGHDHHDEDQAQPAPPPGPDHTVRKLLLSAPRHAGIDDAALDAIITLWGDTPAVPLAANEPIDLCVDLETILGSKGYDNAACMTIAEALIAWIKQLLPHEFGAPTPQVSAPHPATAPAQPADDDAERAAEAELRRMATTRLEKSGMGVVVSEEVCDWIEVSGMGAYFENVIVLEGGDISGMNVSGEIFVPFGVSIEVSGMNAGVKIRRKSWTELLAIARKF